MSKPFKIANLKEYFKNQELISIDNLDRYYKMNEPELKRSTLRWRVYKLVNDGILHRIKRGIYTLKNEKKEWSPIITGNLRELYLSIREKFPYLKCCVWTTQWLIPYTHHLPMGHLIFVETEKGTEESLFSLLGRKFIMPVLLNPTKKEMSNYIEWGKENVIIRNLISQSPLKKIEDVQIPTLEKIVIDLFIDKVVLESFQGNELKSIYENLFENFNINESTLKRYAQRRGKWQEFLNTIRLWELNTDCTRNI